MMLGLSIGVTAIFAGALMWYVLRPSTAKAAATSSGDASGKQSAGGERNS